MRPSVMLAIAAIALLVAGCVKPTVQQAGEIRSLTVDQVGANGAVGARLIWEDFPRTDDASFQVYRDGVKIGTVDAPTRSYFDAPLVPDRAYAYQVSSITHDGSTGALSAPVSFTLTQSMRVAQDVPLGRGFVNLSVVSVSPGLAWSGLTVLIGGANITLDDIAYTSERRAWSHTEPGDDIVDLHENLEVYAPGEVVRNATLDVRLGAKLLAHSILDGRPDLNVSFQPTRNVSVGLEAAVVRSVKWFDGGHDVTASNPNTVARWSDLLVSVNGTALRYDPTLAAGSWSHENAQDDILRVGGIIEFHADPALLHPGAIITIRDAIEGGTVFVIRTH
ncbi:MAG: hypothetical protein ACYDCK_15005 [Thermoplasmatota archaeon]